LIEIHTLENRRLLENLFPQAQIVPHPGYPASSPYRESHCWLHRAIP
jgi:hypothetical protein